MGNLNRHARHILVNTVDQTVFGAYKDENGIKYLVHKPTGTYIPGPKTSANLQVAFGSTIDNVKEVALFDLVAPYPSNTENYEFIFNMTRLGRRQGGIDSHRREARAYNYTIPALGAVSGGEVNDADKLTALKGIITLINNDPRRFADAGMTWVVNEITHSSGATVVITLQDGTEYTVTASSTNGLAAAINITPTLNTYVKAYGPSVTAANNTKLIIENIVPCYFEVSTTDANVEITDFYLHAEVKEEDYMILFSSGTSLCQWNKVPHSRWSIDATACVDSADDADATVVSVPDAYTSSLNVSANTNDASKCLNLAQLLSVQLTNFPTSVVSAAVDVSPTVDVIVIGTRATVNPTLTSDKIVCTETEVIHRWSRLSTEDMFDMFPIKPEEAYMTIERPIPNQDYCMLTISWDKTDHPDVDIMDGLLTKRGEVVFYILKSQLPATYDASTNYCWKGETAITALGATNYMNDSVPGSADTQFFALLAIWYGASLDSIITPGL
jgi:hypothetical protein